MKKKGFTLIELLAVIVILAVIALIATPLIMNVINDARKNSFKDSAYGITKAIELKSMRERLNDNGNSIFVVDLTGTDLDFKGSKPKKGYAAINVSGDIALEMNDGTWCVTKGFTDTDVTITKLEEGCDGSSIQSLDLTTPTSNNQNANTEQIEQWCIVGTVEGQSFNSCTDDDFSFSLESECQEFIQDAIDEGEIQEGDVTCQKDIHTLRYEKELSTLNSNVYFKHTYKDNNPYASHVCFMADKEYCFRGIDDSGGHYSENTNVLESLRPWFEENGGYCNISSSSNGSDCSLFSESHDEHLFQIGISRGEVIIQQVDPSSCDDIVLEENNTCVNTVETLTIDDTGSRKEMEPAHQVLQHE